MTECILSDDKKMILGVLHRRRKHMEYEFQDAHHGYWNRMGTGRESEATGYLREKESLMPEIKQIKRLQHLILSLPVCE